MEKEYNSYLTNHYYSPDSPASYTGPYKMWQQVKKRKDLPQGLNYKLVKQWYSSQITHNVHINPNKNFKREPYIVDGVKQQYQADLIVIPALKKYNGGAAYILVCIDIFSRYGWALSLKTKSGNEVASAMEKILSDKGSPQIILTDRGTEFRSAPFKKLLKDNNVYHVLSYSEKKAALCERLNLTIQQKLYKYMYENQTFRYIDVLPSIIASYNGTIHSSINIAPKDVNEKNSYEIYEKVYMPKVIEQYATQPKYKYSVNDAVRISYERMPFTRGYQQHFSEEIYKIKFRIPSHPPRYKLTDLNNEEIKGSFYEQQLQKADISPDREFKIAKVYKNKKKKINGKINVLVSWLGYPSSLNSYVPVSNIKKYTGKK